MQGPVPSREAGAEDQLASGGCGPGYMALRPESCLTPGAGHVGRCSELSAPPAASADHTGDPPLPSSPTSPAIRPRICLVSDRSLTAWVLWAKSYRALQRLVWSLWAPVRMLGPGARRMGGPYVVPVFIAGCQARATNQHPSWAAAFPEV